MKKISLLFFVFAFATILGLGYSSVKADVDETTTTSSVVINAPTGLTVGENEREYFVTWNKVKNAESYYFAILMDGKLLYELPTLDNYLSISKALVGDAIIPEGDYTIEVWAIGDNGNAISPKSTVTYTFGKKAEPKSIDVMINKAAIKKVYAKKKSAKKLKLKIKACPKYDNAISYQYLVKIYKTKKNAKADKKVLVSKQVSKPNCTIVNKKLKNKKTLFVKVRYVVTFKMLQNNDGTMKTSVLPVIKGAWSNIKKVKVK